MKSFLPAMAAVVLLTLSCEQQDIPSINVNPDAVTFSASIMPATRATDTSFENGDLISVFATDKGSLYKVNYAQNVKYTYNSGMFTTNENLSYPDMNTTLGFYAVYPYDSSYETPYFTFAAQTDQSTHAGYTQSDLMTASNTGRDEEVVNLVFNHHLSKVVLNISSTNLPAGTPSVTFKNVFNEVEADLAKNTFKSIGLSTDIKASPNGSNSFKVIVAPQAIKKGSVLAEIAIGKNTYKWEVEKDLVLASGIEYVFNLELEANSVRFTSDINPWNDPSSIEAVVPKEYIDVLDDYIPIYEGVNPPDIQGVWLATPYETYYDSEGWYTTFADSWFWFYDQKSDNTISMRKTQNLGDLTLGEGAFISGSNDNFTVYFNQYTSHEDGAWMLSASLVSGTMSDGVIRNLKFAFIVLDKYDPDEEYMDPGDYRVIYDTDYYTYPGTWPLAVKSQEASGISMYTKSK